MCEHNSFRCPGLDAQDSMAKTRGQDSRGETMAHTKSKRRTGRRLQYSSVCIAVLIFGTLSEPVHADEVGVSYWLPGRFGSLAAAPTVTGLSMAEVYYHTTLAASGAVAAAREIQIGRIPA